MQVQKQLIGYIEDFVLSHSVVSISGKSGTGKTSLVLYLFGNLAEKPSCSVWIQASELFPKARTISMFGDAKERSDYVLQNTFVIPKRPFTSYSDQVKFFLPFVSDDKLFPPDLKFMIIDNISHHLRYELSTKTDIKERIGLMDTFYESIICPLILKCQREEVILILIHEVTFDVSTQQTRPFFHKLYDRIKSLQITLSKSIFSKERTMDINTGKKDVSFGFSMKKDGFYLV